MEYNLTNLFAIPVFNTVIEDISNNDKQLLYSEKFTREESHKCWVSKDNYVLEGYKFLHIKEKIFEKFEFYARNLLNVSSDIEFYMTNSWIVKHKRGDSAHQHNHTNSIISGILYLNVDDNSGDIIFHRNTQDSIFANLDLPFSEWNIYNSMTWKFTPLNNNLFLFPSTLNHSVSESFSDIERYALVFNFFVKGSFGKCLSRLELN